MHSYFGNDTGPHGRRQSGRYYANHSDQAMVSSPAHALAEAQVLAEFLDGLRLIYIDTKDGKHLFDGSVGGFLARVFGAMAVWFSHLFPF